jgi:hypothetical protein
MKKNILLVLPLCALTIACAKKGPDETTVCQTVHPPPVCVGNPADPKLNINVEPGLTVAPPNVCAHAGTEIDIKVTPPTSSESVATVPKDPANGWMAASNSDPDGFKIRVPSKLPVGNYDYGIVTGETGTGPCLDPRIEVN